MKRIIFAALVLLLAGALPAAADKKPTHRIIMQLASGDTTEWKATINNLRNLKRGWGNDVAIEVVAHGPGVGFLLTRKTTQHEAIRALKDQGVAFLICENSLREKKIDRSEVIQEAGFVPMGIGEIVMKQEEGWSYLKAGF